MRSRGCCPRASRRAALSRPRPAEATPDTVLACPGTENIQCRQIPNDDEFAPRPLAVQPKFVIFRAWPSRTLLPAPGPATRTGPCRRTSLNGRGIVPSGQGPGRARLTPGPPLDLLAALDLTGHDRARPARRHRGQRTDQPVHTARADRVDLQRDLPTVHTFAIERRRARTCPHVWSTWRRRHQHRARTSYYRRREPAHAGA